MKPISPIARNMNSALYRIHQTRMYRNRRIEIYNYRDTEVYTWQVDGNRFAGERLNSATAAMARASDYVDGVIQ